MDALRRQASKFKDQVAKQQQAVIKQLGGTGYESSNVMVIDEVELQRHQQLEKLYRSTRAGRDFQKDIVRAAEGFSSIQQKHIETCTKLSEDCYKYGTDNNVSDGSLAKEASLYGGALLNIEKEHEEFNKVLSSQVIEPLKAMAIGAPLEDARHLAQRYSRMRQEAETLAAEVSRRQARSREAPIMENTAKLQSSESKMQEHKANMAVLGKEAAAALAAVESQQQRLTSQRLLALLEAEKSFHLRVAAIIDDVEAEMISEKQRKESVPPSAPFAVPLAQPHKNSEKALYFLAEAMHPFTGASEKELSLQSGDYVVVRQVNPNGWSEGECRGKAGWFPTAYVEQRQNIPPNKVFPQMV
ncbi:LOW QUALITY PROTEIN: SH3 domain-containing protein 3-like [Dioscorea cayenensis subsp. rotundata]|uniref:LOW QUALITY PROTEIN: SH3 domain-containing protein 3-like n=1 Tax=Dioscorea cayennensis subsp. rotundata TaxID=55577 RepID=A0AB40CM08_DIOCR|nr:LOW QUALITY PROTEIN: SH3 domain-containing protein 3-like [Dioscorea cayenensis subsp. rotundata]